MKRLCAVLLTCVMMLTLGTMLPASAGSKSQIFVYDEGSRLTSEELAEVKTRLQQTADYTGLNVGIIMGTQSRSDYTIESAVKTTYTDAFGNDSDGVLYYMDLKGYEPYDYIVTRGLGMFYVTNDTTYNRIEGIYSALDPYLYPVGSENVYGACIAYCEQVEKCYDAGIPDHFYVYDDVYNEYYHIENGQIVATKRRPWINWGAVVGVTAIGGMIGLIAAVVVFGAVKSKYKFKYSLSPTTYINRKTVQVNQQYDNFVRTNTSRVHIDSGGGGGRSGGGGGGGGGFSSGGFGGGGHHR